MELGITNFFVGEYTEAEKLRDFPICSIGRVWIQTQFLWGFLVCLLFSHSH